jgi:hypothetical protein
VDASSPPPTPAAEPRRPWRRIGRILLWPAIAATLVAALGWFGDPVFAAVVSALLAIVGVPAALLRSAFLIARRRALPEDYWLRESRRVAILVMTLILLVPANLVPTLGKRRFLKIQGRDAVEALESHFRERGSFPARLEDAPGVPWIRGELRYRSTGQDYELSFEDPGYYFMDSGWWDWNRGAGGWRYRFEQF